MQEQMHQFIHAFRLEVFWFVSRYSVSPAVLPATRNTIDSTTIQFSASASASPSGAVLLTKVD